MKQFDVTLTNYAYGILNQHPMTSLMVRIFLPKVDHQFFALIYSYFRWLDDQVDGDELTTVEKEKLLARAYSTIYTSKVNAPQFPEKCLLESLSYGDKNNLPVRFPIKQMATAIEMDMKRIGEIPTKEQLRQLCLLRVCSYLNMLKILTKDGSLMEIPPDYGIACDEIHILRDIDEDFSRGIFNFSIEDVNKYRLNINRLNHPSWQPWIHYKIKNAGVLLKSGYLSLSR